MKLSGWGPSGADTSRHRCLLRVECRRARNATARVFLMANRGRDQHEMRRESTWCFVFVFTLAASWSHSAGTQPSSCAKRLVSRDATRSDNPARCA